MSNIIEETLKAHIREQNSVFVFPTQTAADLWADRIISCGPVTAVAMERFKAWDDFKGSSIRSTHQDKESVPSVMRGIFASLCVSENAEKPFLKSIIVPEYAGAADGFTAWISGLLPGLSMWKNRFTASGEKPDAEDEDLLELYRRYKAFLDKYNLFDPAWETPPFEADGKHYYIFFPEILSDYLEYKSILESSPADITVISIPEEVKSKSPAEVSFFKDSRAEIRSVALYLWKIHEEKKIPWTDFAVSVPDMDTYGPYLMRELALYEIPYVSRNAMPLSSSSAGSFFARLMNCVQQEFSFASIKSLLLDDALPWKSPEVIRQLIDFGKENNCITSYVYNGEKYDVWEKSFRENPEEERASAFYKLLKYHGSALVNATSFKNLREMYFKFRGEFFDMEKCSENSDRILSRCISGLAELIDLEEKFKLNQENSELKMKNVFRFFTEVLDGSKYLAQTDSLGVAILPYKLSAAAPYPVQVVVDSSQKGLSVVYRELSFLRDDKRKKLFGGAEDPNVTELFIKLYEMNSTSGNCYFSAAGKTFDGYAQASSYLALKDYSKPENKCELLENDLLAGEKAWFSQRSENFPARISSGIEKGFEFWKECQKKTENGGGSGENGDKNAADMLAQAINGSWIYKGGKVNVSPSSLRQFFGCPRAWVLDRFCSLNEQDNEAELFDHKAIGLLYHKFYEIFCSRLKELNLPVHTTENGMEQSYKDIFIQSLHKAEAEADNSFLAKELLKTTSTRLKDELLESVESFMTLFDGCFVEDMEREFVLNSPDKKFTSKGRIDCLLMDPENGNQKILVDFKSFNSAIPSNLFMDPETPPETPLEEQKLPDFQMPMYLYLMENQENKKVVENCCYFQVSTGECTQVFGEAIYNRLHAVSPSKRYKMKSVEEYKPTMELFEKALERFCQRVDEKDFSVNRSTQDFETCNGCTYRAVCRRTFNIARKE